MSNRWVIAVGLLITGATLGALGLWAARPADIAPAPRASSVSSTHSSDPYRIQTTTTDAGTAARLARLEAELRDSREKSLTLERQVLEMKIRIASLESELAVTRDTTSSAGGETAVRPAAPGAEQPQESGDPSTFTALVNAGVDPRKSRAIVERQDRLALRRLELRDQAIRDGSFGTQEYLDALRELNGSAPDLRREIGDEAYDRFLFATGQPNRVLVTSVIPESAADAAGMRDGDIIINYDDNRVFSWNELRESTTAGEKGSYVQINVLRGDEPISLMVPRGPLGVRLDTTRSEPLLN